MSKYRKIKIDTEFWGRSGHHKKVVPWKRDSREGKLWNRNDPIKLGWNGHLNRCKV